MGARACTYTRFQQIHALGHTKIPWKKCSRIFRTTFRKNVFRTLSNKMSDRFIFIEQKKTFSRIWTGRFQAMRPPTNRIEFFIYPDYRNRKFIRCITFNFDKSHYHKIKNQAITVLCPLPSIVNPILLSCNKNVRTI